MTSSTKKYSLRSGQDILNIPDEFDDTLLQDVKGLSTETALVKRSTNNSTVKSSTTTKAKSSTTSAKSTSSNSVSEGTRGKNKQTSAIVTRSITSSNKGSSKGSGKGSSTASSKGSSKVREEWYDESIFDNKQIKHEVKVKKEAPSEDSIFCLKCNETFDSIEDLNAHAKSKCYTKYSYKCLDKKCKKTFSQKSNMQQHYYTVHLGKQFKCQYCDSYFTYIKTHTKHEKAKHKDKLSKSVTFKYSCADCTYQTDDKTEYTAHVDRHKSFLRFCCGNCKKGFYLQAHLTYHLSKCFDEPKNFECIKCGMKFATEKELRFHFKSVHVDPEKGEKYYCDTCIVILFMQNGMRHHCRSQGHRRKVAEMSH